MVVQICSGILLAFYYVRGSEAWSAVIGLAREDYYGWLIRLVHSNGASFVFIGLFLHLSRGLYYSSFYLTGPWLSGWVLMLLTMASAFLGYVLP